MDEGCGAHKVAFLDGFELFFHLVQLFIDFISKGVKLSSNLLELLFELFFELKDFALDEEEKGSTILHEFLNFELKIRTNFYVFSRII